MEKQPKVSKKAKHRQFQLYCVSNCALSIMPKMRWRWYSNGSKLEWFKYKYK